MEQMRNEVIRLQGKVRDMMDEPAHTAARRLNAEIQGLEDDLQVAKNKYTIEDRIKRIITILEGEARDARIMDYAHLAMFQNTFEDMRNKVRSL